MTWTDEMLECICNLWEENKAKGWNMITEKYGRMMEHTSPEEYEKIKDNFPEKSERTIAVSYTHLAGLKILLWQHSTGSIPVAGIKQASPKEVLMCV